MTTEFREPDRQDREDDEAPIDIDRASAPTNVNTQGDKVEDLIVKAHDSHLKASRAAEAAKDHLRLAIETGESLKKLKKLIGHGKWLRWFAENEQRLGFSERTSSDYMRMADLSEKDRQRAADLTSIRSVLKALKEKGPPQDPIPRPTLAEPIATLLDVCIQQANAAAVLGYIRGLKEANEVSPDQFEQAVRAVQQEWGAS